MEISMAKLIALIKALGGGGGGGGGVSDVKVNGTSVVNDGVANVPVAGSYAPGVAKVSSDYGLNIFNDFIVVSGCPETGIKQGTNGYKPLIASRQHMSAFYGLAKAAGADMKDSSNPVGTYTPEAKAAIQDMLEPQYRLIYSVTATETLNPTITSDLDGNPLSLKSIFVLAECPSGQGATSGIAINVYDGDTKKGDGYINTNQTTSDKKRGYCIIDAHHGLWKTEMSPFTGTGLATMQTYTRNIDVYGGKITKVNLTGLIAGYSVSVYGY